MGRQSKRKNTPKSQKYTKKNKASSQSPSCEEPNLAESQISETESDSDLNTSTLPEPNTASTPSIPSCTPTSIPTSLNPPPPPPPLPPHPLMRSFHSHSARPEIDWPTSYELY